MRHFRIIATIGLAVALAACNAGAPPPVESKDDYISRLEDERREKDAAFKRQPDKPVPPARMDEFVPLKYYPPNPDYVVPAALKPAAERIIVEMPTSTGKIRQQQRVGVLEFTLKGQPLSLGAFVEAGADMNRLFVPFSDLTSGTDTYDAGRYMELDRTSTGLYEIDFNRAYNPFCYYNASYDCPFPPRESRLPVPIEAGERIR